jgi:hypothetical protein
VIFYKAQAPAIYTTTTIAANLKTFVSPGRRSALIPLLRHDDIPLIPTSYNVKKSDKLVGFGTAHAAPVVPMKIIWKGILKGYLILFI